MTPDDQPAIPAPREGDFEDVRWALSAAQALWARGERAEAIRWLRRGAAAAADRDADARSVQLYKAAAELTSLVEATPEESAQPPAAEAVEPPEGEADTITRPETLLRRALMAIDPEYARRTDYDPDRDEGGRDSDPSAALFEGDDEEETRRRKRIERTDSTAGDADPGGSLPALRVAVLPMPEDGEVRLLFLPPGAAPPPGVATALLVAPTERDAQILASVYAESDAKL